MQTYIIISFCIIALIVFIPIACWYQRKADTAIMKKALDHMGGRPKYSHTEFGSKFYPSNTEIASGIREILSHHLPIDLSKLEPSDKLHADLRMSELDSMADVALIIELEEKFKIKISDADAQKIESFDDICKYIISKIEGDKEPSDKV